MRGIDTRLEDVRIRTGAVSQAQRKKRALVAIGMVGAALLALGWSPIDRHARAAALLTGFEDSSVTVEGVSERETQLAGARARVFERAEGGPPVLLVHGVHPGGIDEPRLQRFARLLAEAGFTVATPELTPLRELRFDASSVETLTRCADAWADEHGVQSVGVVGISVGGGLALRAASRTDAIHTVFAIGAHHDIARLVAWWTGDEISGPSGEHPAIAPERYGAEVLAYAYADDYFDPPSEAAREALGAQLRGETERARELRAELPDEASDAIGALRTPLPRLRDVARAHAEELAAVSPAGALDSIGARVFLLHGQDDPLIASTEALHIAAELPAHRLGGVVRTEVLGHADANALASWSSKWDVVHLAAEAIASLEGPG